MERRVGLSRALAGALGWALGLVGLAFAATMIVPAALGLERYVITGDSMTGTYDRGSLLYSRVVAVDELAVGDVITYVPPRSSGVNGPVTHRIVATREEERGRRMMRTQGDANAKPDPWWFQLDRPDQARAELAIPYVGYAFGALSVRGVRMALIGLPALAIALALLIGHWRDLGREAGRRRGRDDDAPTGPAPNALPAGPQEV